MSELGISFNYQGSIYFFEGIKGQYLITIGHPCLLNWNICPLCLSAWLHAILCVRQRFGAIMTKCKIAMKNMVFLNIVEKDVEEKGTE